MIVELVSIGYGVVSMIGWGCGDFLVKKIVGSLGYYRVLLYTQLMTLPLVLLLAGLSPPTIPSSFETVTLIIVNAAFSLLTLFFFYKGLIVGKTSIVTPVASTSVILAMGLSFVIFGEKLSPAQILSVALVLIGILILSMRSSSDRGSNMGILYALATMFCAGLLSIIVKLVSLDIGGVGTLLFNKILIASVLLVILPFSRNPLRQDCEHRVSMKTIIATGLTEFLGVAGFILGVAVGMISIIAPISSASPAVTVLLAQIFLRERLVPIQWIAVSLIMLGIVLLSFLSGV